MSWKRFLRAALSSAALSVGVALFWVWGVEDDPDLVMAAVWSVAQLVLLGLCFAQRKGEARAPWSSLLVRGGAIVGAGVVLATIMTAAALYPGWREQTLARFEGAIGLDIWTGDEEPDPAEVAAEQARRRQYLQSEARFPKFLAHVAIPIGLRGLGFMLPLIVFAALPFAKETRGD